MKEQRVYFVTGTDTDVGKTYVTSLLLQQLTQNYSAIGYKPIAAGATMIDGQLQNEDAIILRQASKPTLAYGRINPVCFKQPIAPHIASETADAPLLLADLNHWWQQEKDQCDVAIIEGAGGWRLPLNNSEYLSDFAKTQGCEVIVVVGMKLGCLNHALLTIEAIKRDNLNIKGWIANQLLSPMDFYQENVEYLKQVIDAPLLAQIKSNQLATDVVFEGF